MTQFNTPFTDIDAIKMAAQHLPRPSHTAIAAARSRNDSLTKPAGSLGRLEELAIWHNGWRGKRDIADFTSKALIFAGNHGVAARGVSAYPSEVTAQMVLNFEAGGAAINQLTRLNGVALSVIALKLDEPTADFTTAPAMSEQALCEAVSIGWDAAPDDLDCLVIGEMGIGNTTAAAALAAALFGGDVAAWTGRGAGVDDDGLQRKQHAIRTALAVHAPELVQVQPEMRALEAMRRVGGREMAAILGAGLKARHHGVPIIMDGYIASVSLAPLALVARHTGDDGLGHAIAGHVSPEGGHRILLERLGKEPLLDLEMRLGEGSGAALAVGILKAAIACHGGMATFAEAAVSGRTRP